MKGEKTLVLIGILVLLLASLAGCGPTPQPTTVPPTAVGKTPAGQTPAVPTPPKPTTVAPTATPAPEKTSITIVIPEDPPSFNGAVTDTGYEIMVMELVLLGLADIDPAGQVFPELAAELPTIDNNMVVVNAVSGTMDVIWKLRQDVQWADGEPVTADDVVFTWDAIANPETGMWVPGADYTDSVEKVDDYTLIVHYNTIYAGYLTQFGGENVAIWPAHYCDAAQGFAYWDCNQQPLSNGPYILEEWQRGDHLTFARNPNYYQAGRPYIDQIIVKIVPEAAVRKTMTVNGEADVNMWVTEAVINDLKAEPNVKVSFSPTGRWVMRLIPNLAARGSIDPEANPHPILSDVRVRQAMRMAIDVDTISQRIFHGYPQIVWTEMFRPPYACDIPRPKLDPEAAKALLEEAGWKDQDGDGVRECHGCKNAPEGYRMSMELAIYAEFGEELDLAQQLIGEMMQGIGIELKLQKAQGAVMWAEYSSGGTEQTGNFDLDMLDDGYPGIDPTDHLWYYYDSASAEPDAGWNVMRYKNEEVDTLLGEAYTLNEPRRKEVFCRIAQILDEELPQILLWTTVDASAYSARLEGVQASVNDLVTWNVADWKIAK